MRFANVPPPMALHEIALEHNAVDVAVSDCIRHEGSDNVMIAVLHREGHALYTWHLDSKAQNAPWLSSTQDFSIGDIVREMMNLQIICGREGSVVCHRPIYLIPNQNEAAGIEDRALNSLTKSDDIDLSLFPLFSLPRRSNKLAKRGTRTYE